MDLAPSEAWVLQGTDLVKKPAEDILIGESIVVKPGDRIPLDGNITDGTTSINEAPITGESIPSDKTIDDTVFAGTINQNDSITIQRIGLGKIQQLRASYIKSKKRKSNVHQPKHLSTVFHNTTHQLCSH